MSATKPVKHASYRLFNSGLLWRINREILNPYNLALMVDADGEFVLREGLADGLLQCGDDMAIGKALNDSFMAATQVAGALRQSQLGFVIQPLPDANSHPVAPPPSATVAPTP